MNGIFSQMGIDSLGYAMNVASEKNDVIAQNIANVDTPGYKAKDMKFDAVMADVMGTGKKLPLYRTDEKHLPSEETVIDPASYVYDQNNPSVRNDGNDVNEDYEMSQMAENGIRYSLLSQITGNRFTTLKEAIQSK